MTLSGQFLQCAGYRVRTCRFRVRGAWKKCRPDRRDVLDVVAAAEIYAEKGHDDVAVAVKGAAVPPFPEGQLISSGRPIPSKTSMT